MYGDEIRYYLNDVLQYQQSGASTAQNSTTQNAGLLSYNSIVPRFDNLQVRDLSIYDTNIPENVTELNVTKLYF